MHNTHIFVLMSKEKNPFPVTGYKGPEYFCDRESELGKLLEAVKSDRNTTLIALLRNYKLL